ncbi:HD domain-containing protein [uncultured Sphaerochaeta sp.]|uniref:HD domain-containing protein n=1 Tax=uncultured Sphaerochaeta sp. TaxID=886478 RepID=UPI002A0A6A95|nr:HD domain-containing protein [uncultured Sphaerochaeta sp.]
MKSQKSQLLSNLFASYDLRIRDPLWKDIYLSKPFKQLYLSPSVQKLGRIKQLGPAFHLYPGAVHTRLDHSLGVYYVSHLMLVSLLKQAISSGSDVLMTEEGMRTFLCAALLHDIGHFPFAHSLKELPLKSHEALAAELIENEEILRTSIVNAGCNPQAVADIIDTKRFCKDKEILLYRALLSGTLDPDKLDYLNRDAFFCGVPYGNQDVPYITANLLLHDNRAALPVQCAGSVEHILFSKYLMYQNVYWHKTNRAATAMIKKALLCALDDTILSPEQLYILDDEQFFALPSQFAYAPFELFSRVQDNNFLTCTFEESFEKDRSLDSCASSLQGRGEMENALYTRLKATGSYPKLKPFEVIIDIPEPISFETDILLIQENGTSIPFGEYDTLFSTDIGKVFTKSLRKTRIFTPSYIDRQAVLKGLES